ncbi:hypothetical protein [Aquamicrobium sp. LC103]|uniref:hypothetical protein n=1 Tax=Aquamicrobium sp. LC103 TaxID=1120658 RepID=UPI00063E7C61|nr:hypothetical protein [Aquamicrobium sp. LC103]TKT82607.1 hypothetical protein XW59_001195 [Aquamicrobium sp. LC103]
MHFLEENEGCDVDCYFQRKPEKLVLEGYRRWMAGFETGSVAPWEMTWELYAAALGARPGRQALAELSNFVRTLRHCAACPMRSFPFNAHHICRDECLTLGLIAGYQHGDRRTAQTCLSAIACAARGPQISEAAESFADTLAALDQKLLPIPQFAIEDVLARSRSQTVH